jgi:tRNA U34 5-carboxymethylaminomethyl modifying enzyme MnmG/GidA
MVRPETLVNIQMIKLIGESTDYFKGAAKRIEGITPAAMVALLRYVKRSAGNRTYQ